MLTLNEEQYELVDELDFSVNSLLETLQPENDKIQEKMPEIMLSGSGSNIPHLNVQKTYVYKQDDQYYEATLSQKIIDKQNHSISNAASIQANPLILDKGKITIDIQEDSSLHNQKVLQKFKVKLENMNLQRQYHSPQKMSLSKISIRQASARNVQEQGKSSSKFEIPTTEEIKEQSNGMDSIKDQTDQINILCENGQDILSQNQNNSSGKDSLQSAKFLQEQLSFNDSAFKRKRNSSSENSQKIQNETKHKSKPQIQHLSKDDLTQKFDIIFTDLREHKLACKDQKKIKKFKKICGKPRTIVFEPLGTLFYIIDIHEEQNLNLTDANLLNIQVKTGNLWHCILLKAHRENLFAELKKLKLEFELILYTFLPKRFLENILDQIPELYHIFDYFLAREDCQIMDMYLIRDISILRQGNRPENTILVIDSRKDSCDPCTTNSLKLPRYKGQNEYKNLQKLQRILK